MSHTHWSARLFKTMSEFSERATKEKISLIYIDTHNVRSVCVRVVVVDGEKFVENQYNALEIKSGLL